MLILAGQNQETNGGFHLEVTSENPAAPGRANRLKSTLLSAPTHHRAKNLLQDAQQALSVFWKLPGGALCVCCQFWRGTVWEPWDWREAGRGTKCATAPPMQPGASQCVLGKDMWKQFRAPGGPLGCLTQHRAGHPAGAQETLSERRNEGSKEEGMDFLPWSLLVQAERPHCGGRSDFSQTQTCPLQVEAPFWPLSFGISVRIPLLRDRCFQGVHACVTWAPAPFPVLARPSLVPHPFPQHRSADTTSIALCGLSAQPRLSFTTCPRDPSLRPVITHSSRSHVNTTSSRKSSYVSLASSLSAIAQQGPEAVAAPRPRSQAARSSPVTLHRSLRFLDK